MEEYIHDDLDHSFTKLGVIVRLTSAAVVLVVAIIVEFYVASNPTYADSVLFSNPLSTLQQTIFYFVIAISLEVVISQSLLLMKVVLWTCLTDIIASAFSLFAAFFIVDGVVELSRWFQPKDYTMSLGYVVGKHSEWGESSSYVISVNTDYTSAFRLKVRHSAYRDISLGDTVLVRITTSGDTCVLNYKPSHEAIEKFRLPQTYVDGKLRKVYNDDEYTEEQKRVLLKWSYLVVGNVYDIIEEEPNKIIKVGVADSLATRQYLNGSMPEYAKIISQIRVGSKVILRVAESNPLVNEVFDWFPDTASICRYAEPQAFDPKEKPAKTVSPSKMMEVEDLYNSFYCIGRVYGKYRDQSIGIHFEMGISDTLLVDRIFKLQATNDMHICTNVFCGDVLILQVANRDCRLFRVVDWFPDSATIQKYKNPVDVRLPYNQKADTRDAQWGCSDEKALSKHYIEKIFRRSHKQTGYVWALNPNSYDVGVTKEACSHGLLLTTEREQLRKAGLKVGSPVLLQVSDSLPSCNRILKWNPTPEEVEKYKKPVRIVEYE